MKNFLLALLNEKEERAIKQRYLIEKYGKTLISFGLNIPGEVKNSKEINGFFLQALKSIKSELEKNQYSIIYQELKNEQTGNMAFLVVDTEESVDLKKKLVSLEESLEYGRILDIDIFDKNFSLLSRIDLGLEKRKCLLCNEEAVYCIKNKSHNYEELVNKTMEYIKKIKRLEV